MAITTNEDRKIFNPDEIHRGDFIRLRYDEDSEAVNGIVAKVTSDALTVFYLPKMSNVSNYIVIRIEDVELWHSIIYSEDLMQIKEADSENAIE